MHRRSPFCLETAEYDFPSPPEAVPLEEHLKFLLIGGSSILDRGHEGASLFREEHK